MSILAESLQHGMLPDGAGAILGHRSSKLLPSLFRFVEVNHRLTVLEIGVALPETVEFFSTYKCRLHFVDLFGERRLQEQHGKDSTESLWALFEDRLRLPAGTRLDLCLFWDFLCYLDDAALQAFNLALRPWLHTGTRAHAFGVHHRAIRPENRYYGIRTADTITIRDRRGAALSHHPHSQVEMHDLFNAFEFERGVILPDGKLELLMKAAV